MQCSVFTEYNPKEGFCNVGWSASPQVNALQVAHCGQVTQLQSLHTVPSHGQLLRRPEPLQHGRDVGEVVEGQAQAVQLGQAAQLLRQGTQVIPFQRESLEAGAQREREREREREI